MDRLLSMEVFVAVVELGSLTAAAALHEMSPAMAAKHLKNLETRLGLRLMVRTTRRQSLTEAGQAYFARCKGILAEIRDAEQGAEAMREAARQSAHHLDRVLRFVRPDAGHRRLPVHLSGRERGTVAERSGGRPVASRYDLAVRIGEPADSGLIARGLGRYQMMVCAAPSYLERYGTPATPADLVRHQCRISRTGAVAPAGAWAMAMAARRAIPAAVSCPTMVRRCGRRRWRDSASCCSPSCCWPMMCARQADADIAALLAAARPISLLYPKDRQALPKLTTFVNFVVARFTP